MRGGRAFGLAIGLFGVTPAHAQQAEAWCFPSGFHLAVVQRPGPPVVGVATVVDGGSSAEHPGEAGAAHVLEHLWFRSPRVNAPTFDELVASVGAEANAFTTHDETIYVTVAPKRAIRALLAAEAERLRDPLGAVDDATIQNELRVVQNELAERYEGKDPAIRAVLSRFVPDDHPYRRSVGGTGAEVAALDRGALDAYARRAYTAAGTSLYVTGDLEPAAVLRLVTQALPAEVAGGRPEACPVVDDAWPEGLVDVPAGPTWARHEVGVDEPVSLVAWSLPPGFATVDLATTTARLMQWRLGDKGLEASCGVTPMRRMTLLSCEAAADARDDAEIWQDPLRVVRTLWNEATSEHDTRADYWSAVAEYLAGYHRSSLRRNAEVLFPGGYLTEAALEFHRSGGQAAHGEIRAEEAAAFAATWITPERMRGARLVPMATSEVLPSAFHGSRGAPAGTDQVVDASPERLAELVVDPGFDAVLAHPGSGRAVWVLEAPSARVARVSAVYPLDPDQDPAARDLAWRLLHTTYDRLAPDAKNEVIRSHATVFAEDLDVAWVQTTMDDDPNTAVRLLAAALRAEVLLAPQSVEKQRLKELAEWQEKAAQNAGWEAARTRWKALAGDRPHPLLDPTLTQVPRADAQEAARATLARSRAHLVAVVPVGSGKVVLDGLADLARADQAPWVDGTDVTPAPAAARSVTVFASDDPGPQAELTLECHVTDGDAASWWILERALREALGGSLRNDLGVTYGVHPASYETPHGMVLRVDTRVPHHAGGVAARTILDTLERTATGAVAATRIDRYKAETARQTALRWQDPDLLLAVMQRAAAHGWRPGQLGLAEAIAAVDPATLAARLEPCTGREAVTLVGDAAALGAALDAAGVPWTRHAAR